MSSVLEEKLKTWGETMEQSQLPRWDDLPDFHLYMDQVLSLVNDYLSFAQVRSDEKPLTAAMINNYVKLKILPKPVKKRYTRVHLAHLVIIGLLKGIYPIGDIKAGLLLQVMAFRGDYRAAYNMFCRQYDKSLHMVARIAQGKHGERQIVEKLPFDMLGIQMSTMSATTRLFSEQVLVILEAEALKRSRLNGEDNKENKGEEG